jgi:hypothetical protein
VKNRFALKNGLLDIMKGFRTLSSKRSFFNEITLRPFIFMITLLLIHGFYVPAAAEMKQLSEIQNGIFHINPKTMEFTAKTSITDNFIDDEQLDFFIYSSATEPFLPADDNYPYSVIDFNALSSDLVILYKYDSIACCPYPAKAYLSRHNISISDFTNQPSPPTVFFNRINGTDPIYHEKVKGMYFKITDLDLTLNERISTTKTGTSYISNASVNVISACISVWTRKSRPICEQPEVVQCKSCLPPSDIRQPKIFRIIRMPSSLPCSNDPLWLGPPKSSCLFGPPPPERTSAAATNWSYNYHNNFFSDSDDHTQTNQCISKSNNSNSINYCPSCK